MGNLFGHNPSNEQNATIEDFVAYHVGAILQRAREDARAQAANEVRGGSTWQQMEGRGGEACLVVLEQMSFADEPGGKYL